MGLPVKYLGVLLLALGAMVSARDQRGGVGSTLPETHDVVATDSNSLVWPSPPARPRIKHLRTISSPGQLAIKSDGFFSKVMGFFFGESSTQTWLVQPVGIAVSPDDVIYVTDPGAHGIHIIDQKDQKYSFVGETKFGPLRSPVGITGGEKGSLYVSDSESGTILIAGEDLDARSVVPGDHLRRPTGMAFIQQRLCVADAGLHKVTIFGPDGKFLKEFGHRGVGEGEFNFPVQLCGRDTVYVVDALNYRVQKFSPAGSFAGSFGQQGNVAGRFASPKAIAQDVDGNLYVTDALMDNIQIFSPAGQLLLVFGQHGSRDGEFMNPSGIAIDSHNRIYVVDSLNRRIQIFQYMP